MMKTGMNILYVKLILLSFCILITGLIETKSQRSLSIKEGSQVTINGTSTIHDWESITEKVSGQADLQIENRKVKIVKDLEIKIPVNSIKSGKNLMDNKTREALEAKEYPVISFRQTELKSIGPMHIIISGNLSIAGVTKNVDLEANYDITGSTLVFTGDLPIRMSDFDIKPPTAMMGTIKTGDELIIEYKGVFLIAN